MKEFNFDESIKGRTVLVRASLNVPIQSGSVTNSFRITNALPTIEALSARGARTIVVAHIGREVTDSLLPVYEEMKKHIDTPLSFVDDVVGERALAASQTLKDGDVLMLENVRRNVGETKNDEVFAERLAALAGIYINDAFPDSHRSHASIVGVPKFIPSFVGPAFMKEYEGIRPALDPESPSVAIVGGAKLGTKGPLLETLLKKYDHVFVGGALAHDFFVAKGYEVGKSLTSHSGHVGDMLRNSKILLPKDVVVENIEGAETRKPEDVGRNDTIFDIGEESIESLVPFFEKAKFILWNGPMGNFERGYREGTELLAKRIAESGAQAVVGGGDTVASISKLNLHDKFTHVSSAGGAMLHFISEGTLPGIDVLD